MNLRNGGYECLNTEEWTSSDDADIAVSPLTLSYLGHAIEAIGSDEFVDAGRAPHLGPGDEVFMAGRFVDFDGRQKNTPTARFGNIAMLPGEEDFYLIEHHSLPGCSGSPVFVRIDTDQRGGDNARIHDLNRSGEYQRFYGPWLLGLDSFRVQDWLRVYDSRSDAAVTTPSGWVKTNSGMAGVVPAWKIMELLESPNLVKQREDDAEKIKEALEEGKKVQYRSYDRAESAEPEFTQADFEAALRKVSRKIAPDK